MTGVQTCALPISDFCRACLRDTEMQGNIGALGHKPVGFNHQSDVGRLHRDDHIPEPHLVADRHVPHGALVQRFSCRIAMLVQDILLERTRVHSDPDRNPELLGGMKHLMNPLVAPDVSRVDANLVDGMIEGGLFRDSIVIVRGPTGSAGKTV